MKVLLLAFFIAAASAFPVPEEIGGPVEMIVNGVPEGEPLEIGHILDIQLKEHADGAVVATDLLHPLTAVGIAEAAAAEQEVIAESPIVPEIVAPEAILPAPVVLPEPVLPEVVLPEIAPEPVILPEPVLPEVVPEPVILPEFLQPELVVPEPIAPEAAIPEVLSPGVQIPSLVHQDSEVYNNGVVSVTVNKPEEGMLSTLQSWFSMVLNYFQAGAQASHQIV